MSPASDALLTSPHGSMLLTLIVAAVAAAGAVLLDIRDMRRHPNEPRIWPVRVFALTVIAGLGFFVTFAVTLGVSEMGVHKEQSAYLAHELHDTYDLVALSPISIQDDKHAATLTARTSDGHDVEVFVDWSQLQPLQDDAKAYLPDMDLPARADVTDELEVFVDGWPVTPGPLHWDEYASRAVNADYGTSGGKLLHWADR